MNSSSLSAEDLRTCAFVSLICPMRSWRQGLRKLRPARLLLWSNQLTGECDLHLGSPFSRAFCLAFWPSEIPAFLTRRDDIWMRSGSKSDHCWLIGYSALADYTASA
jgi:hypothetical protein